MEPSFAGAVTTDLGIDVSGIAAIQQQDGLNSLVEEGTGPVASKLMGPIGQLQIYTHAMRIYRYRKELQIHT